MIDTDKANCHASDRAHRRMSYDLGLHWHATGKRLCPHVMNRAGLLLLRRWKAGKYPRPAVPQCVGAALRPDTEVTEKGVTVADGVYWYEVWTVSGGGVCQRSPGSFTRVAVFESSAHAGALPNAPSNVVVHPDAGGYVTIGWIYNPVGQGAAPTDFAIYAQGLGGLMNWSTPLATVSYTASRWIYRKQLGPYGDGAWTRFQVRARASGLCSLLPERVLGAAGYDAAAWPETVAPAATVVLSDPAAPPAMEA